MATKAQNATSTRVSAELSAAIERLASEPERRKPPTLAEVRVDLEKTGLQWSENGELLFPQDRTAPIIELDDLITKYGAEAPALDFVISKRD